jgi:heterodisulfide reductase subunit A-like polyferredoxin
LTTTELAVALEALPAPALAAERRHQRWLLLLDWDGETAREIEVETLTLAARLRGIWHSEVTVFYRNLTVDLPGLERLTRAMRAQGVVFCRYGQADLAAGDDGVSVTTEEGCVSGHLLVLPEAVRPRPDARQLAQAMNVRLGRDGYFGALNVRHHRAGLSSRRGIFMAGRCHMDCAEADAIADAVEVAGAIDALLGSGYLTSEEVVAKVDIEKCVRCLTCLRTCPHAAIEMVDYDEETSAARVAEMACYGCGACVANCPVQAIALTTADLPAWARDE